MSLINTCIFTIHKSHGMLTSDLSNVNTCMSNKCSVNTAKLVSKFPSRNKWDIIHKKGIAHMQTAKSRARFPESSLFAQEEAPYRDIIMMN